MGEPDGLTPEQRRARRRRLDRVFGETLPGQTGDDVDERDTGEEAERGEAWLRRQVPPHHGD